jgi:hypothetical protein
MQLGMGTRRWWTGLAPMDARSSSAEEGGCGQGYPSGSVGPGGRPHLFPAAHRRGRVQWQRHRESGGRAAERPHELHLKLPSRIAGELLELS